ncbi:hypothetical protein V6Z88_005103 [Aspergillus fumigatus]
MAGDVTREQVTWLYEVVTGGKDKPFVSNEPGSEGDVLASYLSGHGITLIPWEIETSSVDSPSVTSVPFIPLSRSILHKYQPQADIPFTDYISPADRSDTEDSRWWSARICSREAVRLFYKWALAWRGLPRRHTGLMGLCGVHTITDDIHASGGYWNICFSVEPEKQNTSQLPHITVAASQPVSARDNSILE